LSYKNFDEFKKKIRPYYGQGTFSKNSKLASELIKIVEAKEKRVKTDV